MNFDEGQIISALAQIFGTGRGVEVGIGDDAAVVATGKRTVITTDTAVEGTHFNCEWSGAFEIGRKVAAANLADIYAMGARPTYLVVAVTLTGQESIEWITELAEGIKHEASSCGAIVVGGDLTRGAIKVISITALGDVDRAITRSGATAGDSIFLSSLPGWSAAGLASIECDEPSDVQSYAIGEFCAPTVDYAMAQAMASAGASAMCDISDALIIQAQQLADACGVGLIFDKKLFESDPEFAQIKELAQALEVDLWQWIFAGGEDHVFLATGKNLPGLRVGEVTTGSGIKGLEMKKAPDIWRHFN